MPTHRPRTTADDTHFIDLLNDAARLLRIAVRRVKLDPNASEDERSIVRRIETDVLLTLSAGVTLLNLNRLMPPDGE
ncbi:MAG TPA: hypothetical protein VHS09_15605 [Polyangiaceae bacterium]|nr:hypothetical protein [Polyangiaceae bacterium]